MIYIHLRSLGTEGNFLGDIFKNLGSNGVIFISQSDENETCYFNKDKKYIIRYKYLYEFI